MLDQAALKTNYAAHLAWLSGEYGKVLNAHGLDGVVIHSGAPKPRSIFDDQFWQLRPVPHFHHWLPLETSRSALLIEAGKKPTLFWFNVLDFWEAARKPESDHFWSAFNVKEVADPAAIRALLPTGKRLAFIGEEKGDCCQLWGLPETAYNPPEFLRALDQLRVLKTPYEQMCLREANQRAAVGHRAVQELFRRGDCSEFELHLAYLRATGQDDPETPYKNIVALGKNAATLHHIGYGREKSAAQTLLLDAGAKCLGYDSDITRTAVRGKGAAAATFAQLVTGLERTQQRLCAEATIGRPFESLHEQTHDLVADVLREAGVAKASSADLVASGVTRKFLPHGLGHSLGLQTHDVGCRNVAPKSDNPFLRNTSPIAVGQVFTIEPGIYFIDHLLAELRASPAGKVVDWNLVEALKPFGGVRVEDDLIVQTSGVENATRAFLPEAPAIMVG
ncbi:MAG: Xaa-Pro dipeptidase [Planctomycetes bacterium]|nr:Xaa-Pro dipeptidase [Planctomycetota bacterium]